MDIRIDTLGGRKILYDRSVPGHYGRTGVPTRPFIDETFAGECEACFAELFEKLETHTDIAVSSILTGGVSRAGTGSSYHHKNRAFDLDGLVYEDGTWVADTFPARPHLYLAIEAVLRKHFGTVLSYDYNRAHEDHFHFDNGSRTGFKKHAKSHVIFVQNAIFFVYQLQVGRDGVWGPETEGALKAVREREGIGVISDHGNWMKFLDDIAQQALKLETGIEDAPGGCP